MIREATKEDYPAIEKHAKRFWEETVYHKEGIPYEDGSAIMYMDVAYQQGLLFVSEVDGEVVGFTAGATAPLLGSKSTYSGSEIAWWVDPEHRKSREGLELLKALEEGAKELGCSYWNMVSMQSSMPEQIEKVYKRMGYKHVETAYQKGII